MPPCLCSSFPAISASRDAVKTPKTLIRNYYFDRLDRPTLNLYYYATLSYFKEKFGAEFYKE